jgi:hypothetical protein
MNKSSSLVHAAFRFQSHADLMTYTFRLLLCLLSLGVAAAGEPLKVGDTLPAFSAKDQHAKEFRLNAETRFLLVSFDMSTGKKANSFFAEKPADYLAGVKAVYLSNIYGMPAVGRMFALPKMRKYPHRIILADSEDLLRDYPAQKDRITVIELAPELKIKAISFWDPTTDLSAALAKKHPN